MLHIQSRISPNNVPEMYSATTFEVGFPHNNQKRAATNRIQTFYLLSLAQPYSAYLHN